MMKKITLLLILLTVSFGYAQKVVLEDFEGATPTFAAFEGLVGASITADPMVGGTNGQVLELISAAAPQPWQGAELIMQNNLMDLTSDITVDLDVYSMTAFDMLVKVEDGGPNSATAMPHLGMGWQTITYTFNQGLDGTTNPANGEYAKIVFFPNWSIGANGWGTPAAFSLYIDNITAVAGTAIVAPSCTDGIQNQGETGIDCGGPCAAVCETCDDGIMNNGETGIDCGGPNCSPCLTPPTVPAPTPPNRLPEDVKSIFSDAYTPIVPFVYTDNGGSNMDTYNTNWCPGETGPIMVSGDEVNQITGLGCEGIDFQGARFDASGFTRMHMDIYTTATTMDKSFNIKFSNWNNGGGENNAIAFSMTNASTPVLPNPNPGTWISIDLELDTQMPGLRNDLAQFIISSDLGTVWYDNLYLYKGTPLSTSDFAKTTFSVFPNPSLNSWSVKTENVNMSSIKVFDVLGKNVLSLTPNKSETTIDGSSLKAGLYFAQIKTESGINSIKLIKK